MKPPGQRSVCPHCGQAVRLVEVASGEVVRVEPDPVKMVVPGAQPGEASLRDVWPLHAPRCPYR